MSLIADYVFDNGLASLAADAEEQWWISGASDPANYAAALAAKLGAKVGPTVSAPQDGAVSGRRVVVSAIADGAATADGTATRVVLVDVTGTRLLTCKALDAPQVVTTGNTITSNAYSITIPDAV